MLGGAWRLPVPGEAAGACASLWAGLAGDERSPTVPIAADYPFMDVFWSMIIFFFWVIWI